MNHSRKVKVSQGKNLDRKVLERISFINKNILEDGLSKVIAPGGIVSSDIVQKLFWSKSGDRLDNIIDDLIKDACVSSEALGGGGGEISLSMIMDIIHLNREKRSEFNSIEFEKDIRRFYHKFYKKNLRQSLSSLRDYPEALSIAKEIISSSGRSNISIEKSNYENTRIKTTMGATFDTLCPSPMFEKQKEMHRKDVNVFIVDGIVESVSEIHTILEKASETKEPYLIVARSFLPDVITTIMFNVLRGTIDVFPVSTNINEHTFNVFTDMGVVCNSRVVTHLEGDTISQGSKRDLSKVKSVKVTQNSLQIFNPDTAMFVKSHVNNLKIRESKTSSETESEILSDRIRRLSQNMTYVEIGVSHVSSDPAIVERLDKFFRSYITMIKYGIIQKKDVLNILKKHNLKNTFSLFKDSSSSCFSSKLIETCSKISNSCAKSILSTGCVVYSDI